MTATRYLRQRDTGHIYVWTKDLMERDDMVEIERPVSPAPRPSTTTTLPSVTQSAPSDPAQGEVVPDGTAEIDPNKMVLLVEAMQHLKDPDDFTAAGLPKVEALANIVGFEVTGKERDAAFAEFKTPKA